MKRVVKGAAVLLGITVAIFAVPAWQYFPGHNLRIVEEGAFYGSRQMSGSAIEAAAQKYGIKTLINLRSKNPGAPWYDDEVAACKRIGIAHADFSWSRNSIPEPKSLAEFVELIETGEKPFLAHCQGGTHRTGAAAALYLLLKGADTATARKQFGPMFRDAPIGQVVDLYEQSGLPFKQWLTDAYPAQYEAWKAARIAESDASGE